MLIGSPEKRFDQLFCIAIFSIYIIFLSKNLVSTVLPEEDWTGQSKYCLKYVFNTPALLSALQKSLDSSFFVKNKNVSN